MQNNKKQFHYAYVILISVMIQRLIVSAENSVSGLFIIPVTTALGVSQGQFMLYQTVQYGMLALSSVFVQKLMTKYRYVTLNKIGLLCMSGGVMCMALAKNIFMFYLGGGLNGIGLAVTIFLFTGTMIPRWFSTNVGFMIATASLGSTASSFIANPVVSHLLNQQTVLGMESWRGTYILLALLPLTLGMLNAFALMRENPESMGLAKCGHTEAENSQHTAGITGVMKETALKSSSYKMLILAVIIWNVTITASAYMAAYVTTSPASAVANFDLKGVLGMASTAGGLVGGYLIGGLNDRLGADKGLLVAGICGAAGLTTLLVFNSSPVLILCGSFVLGIFVALNNVQLPAMITCMYGEKDYDRIFPAASSASSWVGAISASMWGFINDFTGGYTVMLVTTTAMCVITAAIGLVAVKKSKTLTRE